MQNALPLERQAARAFPWRIFWLLLIASLVGVVAVLPYAFALFGKLMSARTLPVSLPVTVALQLMQSAIIFGLVNATGLLVGPKVGIEFPLLQRLLYGDQSAGKPHAVRVAIVAGAIVGAAVVAVVVTIIAPRVPEWPIAAEAAIPVWKRLLACLYGGIDEELLMHLFLLGVVLWLLQKISRHTGRSVTLFWIANVIVASLFGAGHLPAAAAIMPLTAFTIAMIVSVNGTVSLVFGYLTWTRGVEAAVIAHFVADLMMHFVGPWLVGHR